MSIIEKLNQCSCGNILKKGDDFCEQCGRKKYRMNELPEESNFKEDSNKKTTDALEFTKKIGAFQLARTKTVR